MPTICLNMIVRNESAVISRALLSVIPYIDYWVISDTGSSDNTKEIIEDVLKDIPGELIENKWIDYSANRNIVFNHSKGKADYHLVIDADETVTIYDGFKDEILSLDADLLHCSLVHTETSSSAIRGALYKDVAEFQYAGVVHNQPVSDKCKKIEFLKTIKIVHHADGYTHKQGKQKYIDKAVVLEKELRKDPGNINNMLFLAESYKDGGKKTKAIKAYRNIIQKITHDEYVFWAKYQIALLEDSTDGLIEAYNFRPTRQEPLGALAARCIAKEQYSSALAFLYLLTQMDKTTDVYFVDHDMVKRAEENQAYCLYKLGSYEQAGMLFEQYMEKYEHADNEIEKLKNNIQACKEAISRIKKVEQPAEYYDNIFKSYDYTSVDSRNKFWEYLKAKIDYNKQVIELGCGTGDLSNNSNSYTGYDFSKEAVKQAKTKFPDSNFKVGNLYDLDWVSTDDNFYVICETLEHLEKDIDIVKSIPAGASMLLSVPSFDDPGHVRFFPSLQDAIDRYGEYFDGNWERYEHWNVLVGTKI